MKFIPLRNYINPKLSIAALGLFFSLTVDSLHVQAMQTEKENLYTRIMKVVFDPADKLNVKYLRTLKKDDPIHYQKLFSPSENAKDVMSAIALVILAGDETRLRDFLKTKSCANFNYLSEKKEKFAEMRCEDDLSGKKEFINKHLRTSEVLNPNDPSLYVQYDVKFVGNDFEIYEVNSPIHEIISIKSKIINPQHSEQNVKPDGITFYSLAHLAIEPYIACQNWKREFPPFLSNVSHVTPESRLRIVDILAEAGTDFNCLPNDYRESFLGASDVDFQKTPLDAAYPRRFSLPDAQLRHELIARALLYGANFKDNYFIDQELLLMKAFNQVWEGQVQVDKIRPTKYVKNELEKIKNNKIKRINSQILKEKDKKIADDLDLNIDDGVKDLLSDFGDYYRKEEEKEEYLKKLSDYLERLQNYKFVS